MSTRNIQKALPYIPLWVGLNFLTLYLFAGIARLQSLSLIADDFIPFELKIKLFLGLPVEVLYNSTALVGILFFINAFLLGTYITLVTYLIRERIKLYRSAVGVTGSILGVLSIGCAACGSLITPTLGVISILLPFSALTYINETLSILSTLLLSLALFFVIRSIRRSF